MADIKKTAVIGAGVMGAGIAAHIANAGIPVLLMDVPQTGWGKKNAIAEEAIARMRKADPAPFMHQDCIKYITPSHTDDLKELADCDWIIEAIVEKIEAKQDLYKKLITVCKRAAIISSNTSTIPLAKLVEGLPDHFQERFLITHFFNPPRYMRLLEVVKGPKTKQQAYDTVVDFADYFLGKEVVNCHDTPGFIANRIGTFWIQTAFLQAIDQHITVEEADQLLSKPLGIPKTGVFGLMDLVGLDLMPLISKSMLASLPSTDRYCQTYREPAFLQRLIEEGFTGRKGKGGFYRLVKDGEQKYKEVLDLQSGHYRAFEKPRLASLDVVGEGIKRFLTFPDKGGRYALDVMLQTLWYSASLVPEIADDIHSIDTAMKLGYGWKWGPFELIDQLGVAWVVEQFKAHNMPIPQILENAKGGSLYRVHNSQREYLTLDEQYRPVPRRSGVLLLSDIKLKTQPLAQNASAALWDIGDGVVCLEFTSKMNALDLNIMAMAEQAIEIVQKDFAALVIYNEGQNFSVGANLGMALFAVNLGLWSDIEHMIRHGQKVFKALKYAPFPVVAAPSGMALGGGCEVLLHADAIQAHSELYCGLVEVGVGLVPAWGGCKEMLSRWLTTSHRFGGTMGAVSKVFEMISTARVAKSAMEARDMMILRPTDRITMNRNRLLADAKARALELSQHYQAPQEIELSLPGNVARVAFTIALKGMVKAGKATAYDEIVCGQLATILSGGDTDITDKQSEEAILHLEAESFLFLIRQPRTWARMEHILSTGKPLRN
jgi:3-hydroxyacyl-CoA dehydrogenase